MEMKRLFADRTLVLDANDGTNTLAEASDVFNTGMYGAKRGGIGICKVTAKTVMAVYEMSRDGTFTQIFGGFGENPKLLCWTESQIVAFCRDPRNCEYLRDDGYETFFLFEGEDGGFFVADVRMFGSGRLSVRVHGFLWDNVWPARSKSRFVIPQL